MQAVKYTNRVTAWTYHCVWMARLPLNLFLIKLDFNLRPKPEKHDSYLSNSIFHFNQTFCPRALNIFQIFVTMCTLNWPCTLVTPSRIIRLYRLILPSIDHMSEMREIVLLDIRVLHRKLIKSIVKFYCHLNTTNAICHWQWSIIIRNYYVHLMST